MIISVNERKQYMFSIVRFLQIKKSANGKATDAKAQICHDFRIGINDFADPEKYEENRVLHLNPQLFSLSDDKEYKPFTSECRDKKPRINFSQIFENEIGNRCKPDYKVKSNAIIALELMMTTSSQRIENFDENGWIKDSMKWCEDTFGRANIVFSVIHKDESTPHMHVQIIPIYDGVLNASKFIGTSKQNRALDRSYYEAVKKYGFQRREHPLRQKNIPISVFRRRLSEELSKATPEPKPNETAVEYCQRIKDWLDNRKAEMFFDVNKERGELREEWTRALAREVELDKREINLAAAEVRVKAEKTELLKYKSDHDCMEAIREMERRRYITQNELNVIKRVIELGKKLLKEMADRVFHSRSDIMETETPQINASQTNHDDLER